jgi:hypothetical protein
MRITMYVAAALAITAVATSACATKNFVRTEVGDVNTKVNTLGTSLEATQERTRQNEAKIGEVDSRSRPESSRRSSDHVVGASTLAGASTSRRGASTDQG